MTEYVSVPKSSYPEVFLKKVFLKKTAEHMLLANFAELLRTSFFRNLRTGASEFLLERLKILYF